MEFIILACIVIGFVVLAMYLKRPNTDLQQQVEQQLELQIEQKEARISQLENQGIEKDTHLTNIKKQLDIASAKTEAFEQLKIEKAKLEEELKYTQGFLKSVQGKLSNERFVNNAPEQVIKIERQKEADALSKIETIKASLSSL